MTWSRLKQVGEQLAAYTLLRFYGGFTRALPERCEGLGIIRNSE